MPEGLLLNVGEGVQKPSPSLQTLVGEIFLSDSEERLFCDL